MLISPDVVHSPAVDGDAGIGFSYLEQFGEARVLGRAEDHDRDRPGGGWLTVLQANDGSRSQSAATATAKSPSRKPEVVRNRPRRGQGRD